MDTKQILLCLKDVQEVLDFRIKITKRKNWVDVCLPNWPYDFWRIIWIEKDTYHLKHMKKTKSNCIYDMGYIVTYKSSLEITDYLIAILSQFFIKMITNTAIRQIHDFTVPYYNLFMNIQKKL